MFYDKKTFLALDVGTGRVRAFGIAVKDGRAAHAQSAAENITAAVDSVGKELGVNFSDGAFITGNLGAVESAVCRNAVIFPRAREIIEGDVFNAICNDAMVRANPGVVLHLIPLQYQIDGAESAAADGAVGQNLAVRFNMLSADGGRITEIKRALMAASIRPLGFFDPIYLLGLRYHQKKRTEIFIDFGESLVKAGVMTDRGLIERFDIEAPGFKIDEKIRLAVLADEPMGSDRYVSVTPDSDITRQDVWDEWVSINADIVDKIFEKIDFPGAAIYVAGAGRNAEHIKSLILENKGLENIVVLDEFAAAGALARHISAGAVRVKKPRVAKKSDGAARVLPSVLCWNVNNDYIYKMFENAGIRRLHIDVQDGFYTAAVSGSVPELKRIRAGWRWSLQAHLMVDDPAAWAGIAAKIGIDSIIVQAGTRNAAAAMAKIKRLGRRCGIAVAPDFDLRGLGREMLKMSDEIIVLAVAPGPSGQAFGESALSRIKMLANTRVRHRFDYLIIADGGINPETAAECWKAGADAVVSGSFLRNAPDFPAAVAELAKQ